MRRNLVIATAVVVVAGGPVAADMTARHVTARVVAGRLSDQLHTAHRPSVHLDGTPFLTQLVSGRLEQVRIKIADADACRLRIARVEAVLRGVRRAGGGARVSSVSGTGTLSWADLSAAVAPLRIGAGAPGQIVVSGGLGPMGFTAAAAARLEGSTLVVEPVSASASSGFGPGFSTGLSDLPPIRIQLRQIPAGLSVDLAPAADGLGFSFNGSDVAFAPTPCAGTGA